MNNQGNDQAKQAAEPEFEFGIYTLGDIVTDCQTGQRISPRQRLHEVIAAAKLADEAGLDVFGVGEHHRLDFVISSVPVVLAAIAQVTERIKLTSATTVLSTIDPVRVFEDFATLDLLSDGRAEIIAGRGAFLESFPLFGYELEDYKQLFSENLDLLLTLNQHEVMNWEGKFRSPLHNAEIAPRPLQQKLPLWVGIGGSAESAQKAGELGVGMAIAILSGSPEPFQNLAHTYRRSGAAAGHRPEDLKIAITSHGYIAKTSRQALDEYYPYYYSYRNAISPKPGQEYRVSREEFGRFTSPDNTLAVGSPQQIIEKILYQHELFGHHRFMTQLDIGGLPYAKVAEAIELLATEVAPVVRRELAKKRSGISSPQ
ncbi:LLM class flavin-dependent oxidoreductase [Paenibacillus sp. FSL R7-0297]|uniref:LLM class flavin-dependent oxidoreductase n=1 Tax=unclassified Paenibacillus TaxID=185978 RepID=UPI0004F795F0|nr:LLM class flavin-dependent oxidoreductase [Paenibacillus sp. FSL R5-0912]AIQ43775.1 luciferase [Paenibacillus sp. FSL R5-0912]